MSNEEKDYSGGTIPAIKNRINKRSELGKEGLRSRLRTRIRKVGKGS